MREDIEARYVDYMSLFLRSSDLLQSITDNTGNELS